MANFKIGSLVGMFLSGVLAFGTGQVVPAQAEGHGQVVTVMKHKGRKIAAAVGAGALAHHIHKKHKQERQQKQMQQQQAAPQR